MDVARMILESLPVTYEEAGVPIRRVIFDPPANVNNWEYGRTIFVLVNGEEVELTARYLPEDQRVGKR